MRPRQRRRLEVAVGATVGGYRIVGVLGAGGMGVVYVGEHLLLGRRAAIKILRSEYSRSPELVQRFFAEARATTKVRNPGIVQVYDFGYTEDGLAYLVMELLDGVSLADRLERDQRLPLSVALPLIRRIALALAAAHDKGVVHGDVKPDNIVLVRDGDGGPVPQIKLLDFGIARLLDGVGAVAWQIGTVVLGTPDYMSPEQCRGTVECDHRTDLYSLGCASFEMLAGRRPFVADSSFELMTAHVSTAPPDLREYTTAVPPDVAAIVDRLLEKDPDQRFQTARDLIAALDAAIYRHGLGRRSATLTTAPHPRPRRWWRLAGPRHRWLPYAAASTVLASILWLLLAG